MDDLAQGFRGLSAGLHDLSDASVKASCALQEFDDLAERARLLDDGGSPQNTWVVGGRNWLYDRAADHWGPCPHTEPFMGLTAGLALTTARAPSSLHLFGWRGADQGPQCAVVPVSLFEKLYRCRMDEGHEYAFWRVVRACLMD